MHNEVPNMLIISLSFGELSVMDSRFPYTTYHYYMPGGSFFFKLLYYV